MPAWPDALPAYPLLEGFHEMVPKTALRTDMEQGPAKVRLRTTAAVRGMTLNYLMSKAQVTALETFYLATLQGGALAFDFIHPRSNAAVSCRFVRPPEYSTSNGNFFTVAIALEVLP
ncbi:MAG: hypothetical protein HY052_08055 [Proteobacteria bacterium]|nr:hypothetical protein [Pseudomonadota bacterium]